MSVIQPIDHEILFSILIPTKNRPETLSIAIQSILEQTYSNFEVIVVNDGEAINSLKKDFFQNRKIQFYKNIQNGVSAARNLGLDMSHGDYVLLLDDDDRYDPDHLEILYKNINTFGSENIYKVQYYSTIKGNKIKVGWVDYSKNYFIDYWTNGIGITYFAFPSKISKGLRFDTRFYLAEDANFIFRASLLAKTIMIDSCTVFVNDHINRTSYLKFSQPLFYYKNEVEAHLESLHSLKYSRHKIGALSLVYKLIKLTYAYAKQGIFRHGKISEGLRVLLHFPLYVIQALQINQRSTEAKAEDYK